MRTTVDYEDALMRALQERATRDGRTLKEEVNECLARGLGMAEPQASAWDPPAYSLGGAGLDHGKAWDLLDELDAQAYGVKRELRK